MFEIPPLPDTEGGEPRRVGLEIEYSGVDLDAGAEILERLVGGRVVASGPFSRRVIDNDFGEFEVEIDAAFLKNERYAELLAQLGVDLDELDAREPLEDLLRSAAATVVPCEIVMPPIAVGDLEIAERIVEQLRAARAQGTGASLLYAFGVHINAELASTGAEYLRDHIRAFILLYDWICKRSNVDLSRRLSPYIGRYPGDYVKLVLARDYAPGIDGLIDDYLAHNPSRNHALDMLPAFAHLDRERVMRRADEPDLIKPRAAFHYRLANCRVDEPQWHIADEWHYWVQIEKLACDAGRLGELCRDYLDQDLKPLPPLNLAWIRHVAQAVE